MTAAAAHHAEAVVIGAGVVGLAVARSLAQKGKEVILLDRASTIGSETSSRNSEVIHSGVYYPRDSRKARHCVEGKRLLYEFVQSHNIPYNQCGKLVVATNKEQKLTTLPQLRSKAINNGLNDVRILSKEDVAVLEPDVCSDGALWSPSAGVLDSHSFLVSLLADAESNGTVLSLNSNVRDGGASKRNGDNTIRLNVNDMDLNCDIVVNCAGLHAHDVAQRIHLHDDKTKFPSWEPPRQYFAKGNYFRLQQQSNGESGSSDVPFKHLIYPVPAPGGLGVHATIDWTGKTTKFGPDVEWIDPELCVDAIDLKVDAARADIFYKEIRKYWPSLQDNALVPDYAGLRPKLYHPAVPSSSGGLVDFVFVEPKDHGIPGLYHMFGIESPGLTSSMSIANYIAERATAS